MPDEIAQITTNRKSAADIVNVKLKHPLWATYSPQWEILKKCYMGGYKFRPLLKKDTAEPEKYSFLRKHAKETDEDFISRHNASYYVNQLKRIYDRYTMYIFGAKNEITRTIEPLNPKSESYYDRYIQDFDLMGTHVTEYMEQVFRYMLTYGICYSLIEHSFVEDKEGKSELEKQKENPLTWSSLVSPLQLINWSKDTITGEWNWVVIHTKEEEKTGNASQDSKDVDVYYYWTREAVYKVDKDNLIYEGFPRPHDFGAVPLITCRLGDFDENGMPEAFSQDIADVGIEYYNNTSLEQEELDNATFPMFLYPKRKAHDIDEKKEELKKKDEALVTGPKRAIRVDDEAKIIPQYINYPTNTLEFKEQRGKNLIDQMEQLAHEKASQIADREGVISGFSIHQQSNKKFMFIALMAFKMQKCEERHWDYYRRWDFDDPEKAPQLKIIYPTNYDSYDSTESRENLKTVIADIPSPTLKTEASMQWVDELLPNTEQEILEQGKTELIEFYGAENQRAKDIATITSIAAKEPEIVEPESEEEEEAFKGG